MRDKVLHFGACAAVALVAAAVQALLGAGYAQCLAAGLMAGVAIGAGKEYGDRCAPGNRWDWADIAADAAGAMSGSIAGTFVSFIA